MWPPEKGKKPLEADPGPLDVLHEDDRLLVVCKPAGLAFQPRNRWISGTLVNRVVHRLGTEPRVVHRLDQGTSGVAIFAKDYEAVRDLHKQFIKRTPRKEYLAVVAGRPSAYPFRVEAAIERLEGSKFRRCVHPEGKFGATDFEVLRSWPDAEFDAEDAPPEEHELDAAWERRRRRWRGAALLRCEPLTGRTHQIRIHAAHAGLPLLGDSQYGVLCPALIGRQALHASRVAVRHPGTGLEAEYAAPLPGDFQALFSALDALQSQAQARAAAAQPGDD
eukprot:tig00020723_g13488.t1